MNDGKREGERESASQCVCVGGTELQTLASDCSGLAISAQILEQTGRPSTFGPSAMGAVSCRHHDGENSGEVGSGLVEDCAREAQM